MEKTTSNIKVARMAEYTEDKKSAVSEWSPGKMWNPLNSYKLLAQVYRWRNIRKGRPVPQPALISVDPINMCNLGCVWCNSDYILSRRHQKLSRKTLLDIADFLPKWKGSPDFPKGVEAVCVGGGGESLLNPYTGEFIERCVENGIEVGIVTNGTEINKNLEALSKCTWVGVSVDAATVNTMKKLKKQDCFNKVIDNVKQLVKYSSDKKSRLSRKGQGYGVSFKYLLHPENVEEVAEAAKIAKKIGCRNFHVRPSGVPWNEIKEKFKKTLFNGEVIDVFLNQVEEIRKLEDDDFGIFGIMHKFDKSFNPAHYFKNCYAIFFTAVFMPPSDGADGFTMGLCCDRRADTKLELLKNCKDIGEVQEVWGSEDHWNKKEQIDVANCPRCTYQPHNQIYEHVILNDSMTYKFI